MLFRLDGDMGGGRESAFGLQVETGPKKLEGLPLPSDNRKNGKATIRVRHIRVGDAPSSGQSRPGQS